MCVDLLMGHIGRNIDKVAGTRFITEFQIVTPTHAGAPPDNVEHGFQFAMMMRTRLRIRLNNNGSSPELTRTGAGVSDGRGARHAGGLRRIGIQFAGTHNLDAVLFPIRVLDTHPLNYCATNKRFGEFGTLSEVSPLDPTPSRSSIKVNRFSKAFALLTVLLGINLLTAHPDQKDQAASVVPTRADILRGAYGPYRANNDVLSYRLNVRIDPEKKFLSGRNSIRFKMLEDGSRIQVDLHPALKIEKILLGREELHYEREAGAVFVNFPKTLRKGKRYSIEFFYSGYPKEVARFGGFAFHRDSAGRPWINTACEDIGASVWWPNKDQWKDEVEEMDISVAIPNGLVDVSNGRFVGKKDLGDGYTRWDWHVHYPINNYDVSVNIGAYEHFSDRLGKLTLDFYALPQDLEKAKRQFGQAKGMLQAYQHYFGEYPFVKDGYKLIEVPYSGMEHQSAVTYGNHFVNGYLERDWTGIGISTRFDFIIIHESGHEWFGNSVSAADRSDMWIHEGWTTYLESLYVEYMYGHDDALRYINAYKTKVKNERPILTPRGVNGDPPQDQYFKGILFINTLRSVVNDDTRWWKLLHDFYQHFKYRNIMTENVVEYFNKQTGTNLTPIFDQYLRHTALPTLELRFHPSAGTVDYRWRADERDFAMPVRVGAKEHWETIHPTTKWQTLKTTLSPKTFEVATNLYYVDVQSVVVPTS
jgi:aminopeptidase N